ncbi:MAG: lactamase [Firmicutes bacterium]|nr:lactamase [Bacillota bacterium]
MNLIYNDLYQFSIHIPPMQFTIHQYLLMCADPILVSTGTMQQAEHILPEIKKLLKGQTLKYILVSHMESDECGGLIAFQKEYPDVITVCSQLCARELPGFGYNGKILAKKQDDLLDGNGFSLKFIDYPSEVHLQNGLAFYEENSKIFFSGDLMLRFGDAVGKTMDSFWKEEIAAIDLERIPNAEKLEVLQKSLLQLNPDLIAVGHGFCIKCK